MRDQEPSPHSPVDTQPERSGAGEAGLSAGREAPPASPAIASSLATFALVVRAIVAVLDEKEAQLGRRITNYGV
jgi:hypothetical protein